jgi:small glutamine-rich tetratricopeptide repeat-containing protein alpha
MSAKSNPKVQRLASSIVKFLEDSLSNGTIDSEEAESIEVATGIIKESFGIENAPTSDANLLQIFDLYEKTRERMASTAPKGPSESQLAEAEKLKGQGNAAVAKKEYDKAIECYTKALDIVPNNKIYLSNRAAAHSQAGQHSQAAADALKAVEIDPGYAKAWSRLGHARYALGDAKGSMEAYEKGLKCEGGQTDVS